MAKVTIKTIANLDNPPTVVAQVNYNFTALQAIIETLLSRDGKTPNSMLSNLDMNSYRILNLPVPVSPTEPARHGDIQQYVDQAHYWADYSETQATLSFGSAQDSAASAAEAEADLIEFQSEYLGAYASPPTLDKWGFIIKNGAFYYDTTDGVIKVLSIRRVVSNGFNVVVGSNPVYVQYWIAIPIAQFRALDDVDVSGASAGDWLIWDGTGVSHQTPVATAVAQNNIIYNGSTVQDAFDDLVVRTSLGIYDISFWASGLMENSERLFRMVASRPFEIVVGAPQSRANSRVAANLSTVLSLQKNGVQFGTITYSASGSVGVFSVPGTTGFAAGDVLTVVAPAVADTALRDTSITLACRR